MSPIVRFCAVAALLLASTPLADAASLTVQPAAGPPTTSVAATIAGFPAGRRVDVWFDTTAKCLVVTAASGGGSCTFKIPAAAQPRRHWISAVDRATSNGVQKPFDVRSNWPTMHGLDVRHDGFGRFENTLSPTDASYLDTIWTTYDSAGQPSAAIVWNGRLYDLSIDTLDAHDAATGKRITGYPKTFVGAAGAAVPPTTVGGVLYFTLPISAGSVSQLHAVDVATGVDKSPYPVTFTGTAAGAPVVFGGRIYVASSDGRLHGFDAASGAALPSWPILVPGAPKLRGTPAIYDGVIYFGAADGHFYGYRTDTRAKVFDFAAGGDFGTSSAAIAGGILYVVDPFGHRLDAFDLDAEADAWTNAVALDGGVSGMPAVGQGKVVVATSAGTVYAADAATGTVAWTRKLAPQQIFGSPIVAGGLVVVGAQTRIFVLDLGTGAVLWNGKGLTLAAQNPVVVDGRIHTTSSTGRIAYGLSGAVGPDASSPPPLASLRFGAPARR